MAASVEEALIEAAPALGKPSRGLRRLIADLEPLLDGEEVIAAAAGEEVSPGWPTPTVVAVTPTRAMWSIDRRAPVTVAFADITAVEVIGSEMSLHLAGAPAVVFRCPHVEVIVGALGGAGVGVSALRSPADGRTVRLNEPLMELLDACVVLGGSGPYPLAFGEDVKLRFAEGALSVVNIAGVVVGPIRYEDIVSLELGGAGRVTTNAGVIGGGFGLEGAITGIAIAGVLNALTTRTTVESILHVTFDDGEIFIANGRFSPDQLRLMLSEAFVAMRRRSLDRSRQ